MMTVNVVGVGIVYFVATNMCPDGFPECWKDPLESCWSQLGGEAFLPSTLPAPNAHFIYTKEVDIKSHNNFI